MLLSWIRFPALPTGKYRQKAVSHLGKHASLESVIREKKQVEKHRRYSATEWFATAEKHDDKLFRFYGEELA